MNKKKYTPRKITELANNEIFVFGSNLDGLHYGGAAKVAMQWGAIMGQGVGLQGQTYAIPTMEGSIDKIKFYVDEFIDFARINTQYTFLVTRIGCGIAGYKSEEIAQLFGKAVDLDNIILPEDFVECINPELNIFLPEYIRKKTHGQTRTLVDMLVELNSKNHYTSATDALSALEKAISRVRTDGDEMVLNCSTRSLYTYVMDCFEDEKLDVEKLGLLLNQGDYNAAYKKYLIEKTTIIIKYLNSFRRYTNYSDLLTDFERINRSKYYGFLYQWNGHCIWYFLSNYITKFWNEIAPNGILDNALLHDFMLDRHERGVKKYGLSAVIGRNYQQDACHSEVLVPYRGGAAPIYVEDNSIVGERRFNKSCGQGMGSNRSSDLFEFELISPLLEEDENYTCVHNYYIPKNDFTLPVFYWHSGMMSFNSMAKKITFIKSKLGE